MAYDDIKAVNGPMGGHSRIQHFQMNASETFGKGEPVAVNADGELTETLTTGAVPADIIGIAMGGPAGPAAGTLNDPRTNTTYATGAMIPVAMIDMTSYWSTQNYTEGTAFSDAAPTTAVIGDVAGLVNIGGSWGIDNGQDANEGICRIYDILNSRGETIQNTNETLATTDTWTIIFMIGAHQGTVLSAELAVPSA